MDCELTEPHSMDEALNVLSRYGRDAMPIAGGQSLLVMLRNGLISPKVLVSLENLAEIRGIEATQERKLCLGAMVTCSMLKASREIREMAPFLAQAAGKVASTPIRNLGTIGGNISHNELGADLPPPLLVLDEPFYALDAGRIATALELLSEFQKETGWQILLLTKDPAVAEAAKTTDGLTMTEIVL